MRSPLGLAKCKARGGGGLIYKIFELMTPVFVEQPLASPGFAKYVTLPSTLTLSLTYTKPYASESKD